jgi:hypothetical protein
VVLEESNAGVRARRERRKSENESLRPLRN